MILVLSVTGSVLRNIQLLVKVSIEILNFLRFPICYKA